MTLRSLTVSVRRIVGVVATAALVTAVSTPAFAASPTSKPDSPFSAKSVAKAVAPVAAAATPTVRSAAPPDIAVPAAPAPMVPRQSTSFFKSRTGAIVLAVFVVGAGYAVYSAREDRIRGINR